MAAGEEQRITGPEGVAREAGTSVTAGTAAAAAGGTAGVVVGRDAGARHGAQYAYDRVKQALHLQSDRGSALREAAMAVRKAGTLSVVGVYGVIDKFPMGVLMNKGITVRTAQQPGQRYMPRMLEHVQAGQLDPSFLATHTMPLDEAPRGYQLFKEKEDDCLRAVFTP